MAHAVAALAGMLNPELVVISGAVADDGDLFLDRIRGGCCPTSSTPRPGWRCPPSATTPSSSAVRMALDHVEASLLGSPGASWPETPALGRGPAPG